MNRLRRSYELLGVSPSAKPAEVRRAYRNLVRVWHPDLFTDNPPLQARAQERLKEINEAYRLIQEDFASSASAPAPASSATKTTPRPRPPAAPAFGAVPRPALFPFFTTWENIPFLLLVAAVFYLVDHCYPNLGLGAGYALRLLAVPFALAVVCHSRLGTRRLLWRIYLAVTLLCCILTLVDVVRFSQQWQRETRYRDLSPAEVSGGYYRGDFDVPPSSLPATGQSWRDGPIPPSSPVVSSPASPLPPAAPSSPAAPTLSGAR